MAKVSVLSFPRYYNYGTFLQLYAMQQWLQMRGYQPEIIDYDPYNDSGLNDPRSRRLLGMLKKPLRYLLPSRLQDKGEGSFTVHRQHQKKAFRYFLDHHLRLGPRSYFNAAQLAADPPTADAYIVGSDQVWNPRSHYGDPAFFLSFAEPTKRIAYAPSFGSTDLPEETHAWYRQQLAGMAHLSARELSGAALIRSLTGRAAPVVLDPVFLLQPQDWSALADTGLAPDKPYLVAYLLESDSYMRELALRVARERGLIPLMIPVHPRDLEGESGAFQRLYGVGPREFVGLISKAAYVCTDSFHGTSFSILLNKPFITFERHDNPLQAANHSRIETILSLTGLNNRLVDGVRRQLPDDRWLDFASVNRQAEQLRSQSLAYLQRSLDAAVASTTGLRDTG